MVRLLLLMLTLSTLYRSDAKISVKKAWLSDPSEQKKDITALLRSLQAKDSALENYITLTSEERQVFEGIGGSFMRAGAKVLNQMPPEVQDDILQDLFDQGDRGARFTLGKVPIAATDFGVPVWYSYAEEEQDESMPDFSIDYDLDEKEGFIPYVKRASKIVGQNIRLEATMDYAPHWMLNTSTPLPEPDLNSTYLGHLANYFLKYTQAMEAHGTPIEYLSMFNENLDSYMFASYETCRDLLVNHVAPLFKRTPGAPKLTWSALPGRHASAVMSPPFYKLDGVAENIDVIFYHGYDCNDGPAEGMGWQCTDEDGSPKSGTNTTCPYLDRSAGEMKAFLNDFNSQGRQVWMTELCYASEFADYNPLKTGCPDIPRYDFQDATQWAHMMFTDFNIIEANAWIYWNMILDTTGGPWLISPKHNDPVKNPQQPVIIADPSTKQYWLTGCYYALWHFGRINSGSTRVVVDAPGGEESIYPTLSYVAFYDSSEDTYTIVLMNDDKDTHTMALGFPGSDEVVEIVLPASSLATVTVTV